jgi:hypothetical protein
MNATKTPPPPLVVTEEQAELISIAAERWEISDAECLEQIIQAWAKAYFSIAKSPKNAFSYLPTKGEEPQKRRRNPVE